MVAKLVDRLSLKTAAMIWICWLISRMILAQIPVPTQLWVAFMAAWTTLFGLRVWKYFTNGVK